MNDNATSLALVAIVGSVITALFKLLRDNTKALERVALAGERTASEAEARNGHLAEISVNSHKQTLAVLKTIPITMQNIADKQASAIINAVKIDKQIVNEQTVKHQTDEWADKK